MRSLAAILLSSSVCVLGCGGSVDGDGMKTMPSMPGDPAPGKLRPPGKTIFVSSSAVTGDLLRFTKDDGSAADKICANLAAVKDKYDFGPDAKWMAWISYNDTLNQSVFDALGRLKDYRAKNPSAELGPWFALSQNYDMVFRNIDALASGTPLVSIRFDDRGREINTSKDTQEITAIWTGTSVAGTLTSYDTSCHDDVTRSWASKQSNRFGTIGRAGATNQEWTNAGTQSCDKPARIICLQL